MIMFNAMHGCLQCSSFCYFLYLYLFISSLFGRLETSNNQLAHASRHSLMLPGGATDDESGCGAGTIVSNVL